MDFVFFNCNDLDQQPERVRRILSKVENIFDNSDVYWGIGANGIHYSLDPKNIKNNNSSFSFIDPNKPLISSQWRGDKSLLQPIVTRDTPQSQGLLRKLGIMPFEKIYKVDTRHNEPGRSLWDTDKIVSYLFDGRTETDDSLLACDYFALMIDPTKDDALVGVAKALISRPGSDTYDVPSDSEILPDTIDYVYISGVDIHPNYRGKGHCKPLVTFLMNQISEILPTHKYFFIDNASYTEEGIPACVCYVKSGKENGYDVYYNDYINNPSAPRVYEMTPELCYTSDEKTRFWMPDVYFYIKKSTQEGGMSKKCNPKGAKPGLVCNPATGRWIKADGALAKKLGLNSKLK